MNETVLNPLGVKIKKCDEYAIEYFEDTLSSYENATKLDKSLFVSGVGHKKVYISVNIKRWKNILFVCKNKKNLIE